MLTRARKKLGGVVVDGFFNGVSRAFKLHPRSRPARHAVEHLRDIPYRSGGRSVDLLDVWRPAGPPPLFRKHNGPPWPIVFYVHGGGFRILSKDTHWIMGLSFARRGFVVFNVSYRLAPKYRYPAAIEDVCEAFAWVAENAAQYGGDPSRIVLAGESAGANLVSALSIALAYEREEPFAKKAFATGIVPKAVLPACGVFQVSDLDRLRRRKPKMSPFIADRLNEVSHAYLGPEPYACSLDLCDPVSFFERGEKPARELPPYFLPVGTKDPLLPDTRRMAKALQAMDVVAEDHYYPGEVHAFHAFVMRGAAQKCWDDTFRFVDRFVG